MSNDVKWIKIVTDIFDDEKMLFIDSLPDADAIIVIWFKLLCLAGKQNNSGVFLLNNRIPYTEEMFANIFRRKVNTIRLALKTFENLGMVEIVENAVTIPNWGKHQSLDDLEKYRNASKARSARYREKQKAIANQATGDNQEDDVIGDVTVTLPSRDASRRITPVEEDIEEEREEEIRSSSIERSGEPSMLKSNQKRERQNVETKPLEPPVVQIELIDGTKYDVTQSEIDYYSALYPAVDVLQEFRNISGWNHSNPKKRKTRGGIKRHINTWLADKQNNGGGRRTYSRPQGQAYTPVPASLPEDGYDNHTNPFKKMVDDQDE